MNGHPADERDDEDATLSIPPVENWLDDDDVTLPDVDYELLAAFAPPGVSRKPERHPQGDDEPDGAQHHIIAAAEAYALAHREHPREQRQWAELAPAPVRALFLAIRDNTPGGQVRDSTDPVPYRHDATILRLHDLSADLQALLEVAWSVWATPRAGQQR
jgi:hypothetical protein